MSATILAWLLSIAGAALFFAAGVLYQRLRSALRDARSERAVDASPSGVRAKRELVPAHSPAAEAGSRAELFQAILDRETDGSEYAGAVIADELGLVVAARGDYGDALAAYGAFLAGIGTKTRSELPLHELRQVIVQDDRDAALTIRPLAAVEDRLALVTLDLGRQHPQPSSRASSAAR